MPNPTDKIINDTKAIPPTPTAKKQPKFVPVGFIIIPTDSEPKLESTEHAITWWDCFSLNGCSSLICVETWLTHFCLPLIVTVGIYKLLFFLTERSENKKLLVGYHIIPHTSAGILCSVIILLAAVLIVIGTSRRIGGVVIASMLILLAATVMVVILFVMITIHGSEYEVKEYLQKIADGYGRIGVEDSTREFDYTQIKYRCCGVTGPSDWLKSQVLNPYNNESHLPQSCCETEKICESCSITYPNYDCYYTMDQTDIRSFRFHKKGCTRAIRTYFLLNEPGYRIQAIASLVALILTMTIGTMYFIRIYARLSNHVHPKLRTLVDEIVDQTEDEIFHFDNDDSLFDSDVKDYLRFNLSRCETIEEVHEFLSATVDVRTYIRHLQPEEFARDILSGKPILLQRFENALVRLKSHKDVIDEGDPYLRMNNRLDRAVTDDEQLHLQTSTRASKNQKEFNFLKNKAAKYKIFTHRAEDFQRLKKTNVD